DELGKPLLLGDQTLWCVFNDADTALHNKLFETKPLGIEVQMTVWGYDRGNLWGDMMFVKAMIIHKGLDVLDSTFVAIWDDTDLGDASDDLAGCDSILDLGFAYNADDEDHTYGAAPPAIGRHLLQGPVIPSPPDSARVSGRQIPGFRNLGMTTFPMYLKTREPRDAQEAFNYMTGRHRDGTPIIDPLTGDTTNIAFPGKPDTDMGWTARHSMPPQDIRFLVGSGPFTLAPGDTQEVVFAVVIALGSSNLNSVTRLKESARLVQTAFQNDFQFPELSRISIEIPPPSATATEITINSEIIGISNISSVAIELVPQEGPEVPFGTPLFDDGQHNDGSASDGEWGTTFTISNQKYPHSAQLVVRSASGIDTIPDLLRDLRLRPSPIFTNFHIIWEDGQQDNLLNDGEMVHMAFDIENTDEVNAIDGLWFDRRPDRLYVSDTVRFSQTIPPGKSFRSDSAFVIVFGAPFLRPENIVTKTFHGSFDNNDFSWEPSFYVTRWYPSSRWRDTVSVSVVKGIGENHVQASIADPAILNGHTYVLSFYEESPGGKVFWQVLDESINEVKFSRGTFQEAADAAAPIVDGIRYDVYDVDPGFSEFLCVANGSGPLAVPDMAAFGFQGFPSSESTSFSDRPRIPNLLPAPGSASPANGGLWGIHAGGTSPLWSPQDASYFFFESQVTHEGAQWKNILPNDFEIRFTPSGGKARLHSSGAMIDVPFELWNLGLDSPEDPSDDYRMIPFVTDIDSNASFNLTVVDHSASGGSNDPMTDLIDFVHPNDTTAGSTGYDAWVVSGGDSTFAGAEGMSKIVLVNFNGGDVTDSTWPANVNQLMPASGTIYRIMGGESHDVGDLYRIVAPSNANGEFVRFDLLQNYPNPFNLSTKVPFSVQRESRVILEIYDLLGRKVRVLKDETMRPGSYEAEWNGLSDAGKTVSSGAYFVRMRVDEFVQIVRMLVLK
ncbi:MAG TPA: choice-of-anchor X domain-containing protein, partial [Bacteroidota bacterium]